MGMKFKTMAECDERGCNETCEVLVEPTDIRLDLNHHQVEEVNCILPKGWSYSFNLLKCDKHEENP